MRIFFLFILLSFIGYSQPISAYITSVNIVMDIDTFGNVHMKIKDYVSSNNVKQIKIIPSSNGVFSVKIINENNYSQIYYNDFTDDPLNTSEDPDHGNMWLLIPMKPEGIVIKLTCKKYGTFILKFNK